MTKQRRWIVIAMVLIALNSAHGAQGKEIPMGYKIEVQDLKAQSALVMKSQIKIEQLGAVLAQNLPQVFKYALGNGATPAGMPFTRFIKNGETVEIEAGLPVNGKIKGEGKIELIQLHEGKVAVTSHFGSYDGLVDADKAVKTWILQNGKRQAGNPWHVYVSDPATTAPEKIETKIYYPIQ
jgi:effector-binding domain-containing protein